MLSKPRPCKAINPPQDFVIQCLWDDCHHPTFLTQQDLYIHLVQKHVMEGLQECLWRPHPNRPPCHRSARHRGQLLEHVMVHMHASLKPFTCKVKSIHEFISVVSIEDEKQTGSKASF
jgi:hypothetical protein